MNMMATECLLQLCEERHELEDYQGGGQCPELFPF